MATVGRQIAPAEQGHPARKPECVSKVHMIFPGQTGRECCGEPALAGDLETHPNRVRSPRVELEQEWSPTTLPDDAKEKAMTCVTPFDTALNLVYGECSGMTPAQIRSKAREMLRSQEIAVEVFNAVTDIIRPRGNY